MTNALEERLARAGDDALEDSYFLRHARPGETCTFCEREFEPGEVVDTLFITSCLDCMAEIDERNRKKREEQNNG